VCCEARQPDSDIDRLIVVISILCTVRHTHTCARAVVLLLTSDQLVAEAAVCTTHNKHNRQTPVPSTRFEPSVPAIKGLWAYVLDRTATEIGLVLCFTPTRTCIQSVTHYTVSVYARLHVSALIAYHQRSFYTRHLCRLVLCVTDMYL
jgi:hypothetical protein